MLTECDPPEPSTARAQPPPATILIVDDRPLNLIALEAVLEPLGQPIVTASSGEEALYLVGQQEFAVALLDIRMPGIDGLVTADRVQASGRHVPIIFVTAGDTPALEGYAHGAVDVLRKPLDPHVVRAKVAVFIELFRGREKIRQQAAALAAQERLVAGQNAALLNASPDAVIGMDHAGCIIEFNSAAEAMFGYPRKDVLGLAVADLLVPPRLRSAHQHGLAKYLATGETRVLDRRIEVDAVRADGTEFPIELAVCRVAAEGQPTFMGYARDITQRKRIDNERAFLAAASEALSSSIDYEVTLRTVAELAVPHVADWCAVEIADGEVAGEKPRSSEYLAVAHVDPKKVELARDSRARYPPDPASPRGVPNVLRTGKPELYEVISDELLERSSRGPDHLRLMRELGLRSAMIVPIAANGDVFGAMTFVAAESGRQYGAADLATAEELARRAALAIGNARVFRAAKAAEERNRFLAEASRALASSLDYAVTLERVARVAVPAIADCAAVYRLEAGGAIRLLTLAASDSAVEALSRELDTLLPLHVDQQDRLLARVIRSGRAEVVAAVPQATHDVWSPTSRARELVQQLSICSYMAVPLIVRGQVLGAITLTTSASGRRFTAADLSLAEEFARRAGIAMDNAELYHELATANRLKDEFLATVSHELRTPLTAILGWTHVLRKGNPSQMGRAVETIERNALVQARIVDDVLDVSAIITGKLRLELQPVDFAEVCRAALDTMRPSVQAKGVHLLENLGAARVDVTGDPARLQQVVWNLLANAIKFTPSGGRVTVALEKNGTHAELRVSDDGQGIAADFLPHVFERFRQADSAPTRQHGGLGLGLAIVHHLVERHGGHVVVASEGEGHGATFTVALPLRPDQ